MLWSLAGGGGAGANALRVKMNIAERSEIRFLTGLAKKEFVFMALFFGKVYAQKRTGVPQLSEATNRLGETTTRLGEACKIKAQA